MQEGAGRGPGVQQVLRTWLGMHSGPRLGLSFDTRSADLFLTLGSEAAHAAPLLEVRPQAQHEWWLWPRAARPSGHPGLTSEKSSGRKAPCWSRDSAALGSLALVPLLKPSFDLSFFLNSGALRAQCPSLSSWVTS